MERTLETLSGFQQDLLKQEIDLIDRTIARIDQILYNLKQWTVGIWTGAIALIIGGDAQSPGLFLISAIVPFSFCILDIIWKQQLLIVQLREEQISNYVNGLISDFKLLDPIGKFYSNSFSHKPLLRQALIYKEMSVFYLVMMAMSVLLYFYYRR